MDNPACPQPTTKTVGSLSMYDFSKFLISNQFGALKSRIVEALELTFFKFSSFNEVDIDQHLKCVGFFFEGINLNTPSPIPSFVLNEKIASITFSPARTTSLGGVLLESTQKFRAFCFIILLRYVSLKFLMPVKVIMSPVIETKSLQCDSE